jgi:hypothetical protein
MTGRVSGPNSKNTLRQADEQKQPDAYGILPACLCGILSHRSWIWLID